MWLISQITGSSGWMDFRAWTSCHLGTFRYPEFSYAWNPRWMAAIFSIPTRWNLSIPPIHSCKSGCNGFLTITGIPVPRRDSASSCTKNGLPVVRAPIQKMSIPAFKAASTCCGVATSVAVLRPATFPASFSQFKPSTPEPSKLPGRVRGFHEPALRMAFGNLAAIPRAVSNICLADSALQGPATSTLPASAFSHCDVECTVRWYCFIVRIAKVGQSGLAMVYYLFFWFLCYRNLHHFLSIHESQNQAVRRQDLRSLTRWRRKADWGSAQERQTHSTRALAFPVGRRLFWGNRNAGYPPVTRLRTR